MNRLSHRLSQSLVFIAILCLFQAFPAYVRAELVNCKNFVGSIDLSRGIDSGPVPFTLNGQAPHIGNFTSRGEVTFRPGEQEGTLVGSGPVILRAPSGDLLVGMVAWTVSTQDGAFRTTEMQITWRDSVTFKNGYVAHNTGRFIHRRPSGLVVIAIIAILVGMLLPAIQKPNYPGR